MFNKNKSFTIIELIIAIMLLSGTFLISYQLFQNFLKENTKQSREDKFKKFTERVITKTQTNYIDFLISDGIRRVDNNQTHLNYDTNDLYPMGAFTDVFVIGDVNSISKVRDYFGFNKKELTSFSALPFELYIINNYMPFNGVTIPFKRIYTIDWGEIERWKSFSNDVKRCLIEEKEQHTTTSTTSRLDFRSFLVFSKIEVTTTCQTTLFDFGTTNKDKWQNLWESQNNMEITKEKFVKIIRKKLQDKVLMKEINTFDLSKEIVEINVQRAEDAINNINAFAKRSIEVIGSSENIDHFVYCFIYDDTNFDSNKCRFTKGAGFNVNRSKIKNDLNSKWDGTSLLENHNSIFVADYSSAIFSNPAGQNSGIIGTTGYFPSGSYIYYDFPFFIGNLATGDIYAESFLPMVPPLGLSETNAATKFDSDGFNYGMGFNFGAYSIFGYGVNSNENRNTEYLTEQITSSKMILPFLFTNFGESELNVTSILGNNSIVKDSLVLNKPVLHNIGGSNTYTDSGPYSAGVLVVFPWILNDFGSLTNKIINAGYGWVFKKVYSSK